MCSVIHLLLNHQNLKFRYSYHKQFISPGSAYLSSMAHEHKEAKIPYGCFVSLIMFDYMDHMTMHNMKSNNCPLTLPYDNFESTHHFVHHCLETCILQMGPTEITFLSMYI